MIEKMTKYSFLMLSSDTETFLEQLRATGLVDIKRSSKPVDGHSAALLDEINGLQEDIKRIRNGSDGHLQALRAGLAVLRQERLAAQVWGEFDPVSLSRLENESGLKVSFHICDAGRYDSSWEERYTIVRIAEQGRRILFVVIGTGQEDFPVPETERPQRSLADIDAAIGDAEEKIAAYSAELSALSDTIPELEAAIREKSAELNLYLASVTGEKAVDGSISLFEGYAPTLEKDRLCAIFDTMDIYWTAEDAAVEDNPPIEFRNNRFVRMFEPLTDMYGRPAYNGFDPTPYISVFFLLFFAMCMGDAGYGLVLTVVGLLLRKSAAFGSLSPLVVTLGAGTTVIGFLFHTFFSIDISGWEIIRESGLDRIMVPSQLSGFDGTMVLAIVIGVIHLSLAMIVKTAYATKNNGFFGSLGIWGWTLFIVGGFSLGALTLTGIMDGGTAKTAFIVLSGVSAIGIFLLNDLHRNPLANIGSGLWEAYNTATGVLGDILSYLRLYALGLAGGMLGYAFNDLARMTLGDGGAGWIPFILILTVGHVLNIAMAALGAFVHPLRLNFLEFFKNSGYEAAGKKYDPLKK